MATRHIPARTEVTCDGCGKVCTEGDRRRNGHITVGQHALDYQGYAVADGTVQYDLCDECLGAVSNDLERALKALKHD